MRQSGKHIKQKISVLLAAIAGMAVLSACGMRDASVKAESTTDNEEVVAAGAVAEEAIGSAAGDETGGAERENAVVPPQRVIALSKSNAELWLLAGGQLCATTDDAMELEGLTADTQSLGDMDHVSMEAVLALEPELVILFSTDPSQKALGEALEAADIQVIYTNIDGFSDYEAIMAQFVKYTGRSDLYAKNVAEVKGRIEEIKAAVPRDNSRKTYLLLHVSATKSKVEKQDYFASEIFEDLGLYNIAADNSALDELSIEAILAADPDYIFVVPRGNEKKALESFDSLFRSQPAWEALSAVQNQNYYLLSKDLFGLKPNHKWDQSYQQAYDLLYAQ